MRLGFIRAAGAVLVARALTTLGRQSRRVQVSTREGTTPSLLRALRAGVPDLALLSSRPPHRSPDADDPPLRVEPLLGIWPGLPGRPRVQHAARDWLTKLHLVAGGAGITTVPSTLVSAIPPGVRLVTVDDLPEERRRVSLVRLPGPSTPSTDALVQALRRHAADLADQRPAGAGQRPACRVARPKRALHSLRYATSSGGVTTSNSAPREPRAMAGQTRVSTVIRSRQCPASIGSAVAHCPSRARTRSAGALTRTSTA